MKKLYTSALLLASLSAGAQWYQTSNPGPSTINCLLASGSTVYAGTNGNGFHYSTDNGNTWRSQHLGLSATSTSDPGARVMCMVTLKDTLYAGLYTNGMSYFNQAQKKWKPINTGIGNGTTIRALLNIHDTVILAGGSGLFRTSNGGQNWKNSSTGLNGSPFALVMHGNTIYAGTNGNGVYKSTDWGYTWTKADSGMRASQSEQVYVNSMTTTSNAVYATVSNSTQKGVFKLANGSDVWQFVNNGNGASQAPPCIISLKDTLFIGTGDGLYKSADGGSNWVLSNTGLPGVGYNKSIASLCTNGTDIYAGLLQNGFSTPVHIFRSTNMGATWTQLTTYLNKYNPTEYLADGNNIYAGVSGGNSEGGVFRSTDLGVSWTKDRMPGVNFNVTAWMKKGNRIFMGGSSSNGVGQQVNVFHTDTGTVWLRAQNTNLWQYMGVNGFALKNDSIFIATSDGGFGGPDGGVWVSADDAGSWASVSTGIPGDHVTAITVVGNDLFIATRGVMRSTDNGASWTASNGNLPSGYQAEYVTSQNDTLIAASNGNKPYYSVDKGQTWTQFGSTYPSGSDGSLRRMGFHGGRWFASTNAKGMYVSDDAGMTWTTFNEGAGSSPSFQGMAFSNGKIFAGPYMRSVSGSDSVTLPVVVIPTGVADAYRNAEMLMYPNPCREQLTLESANAIRMIYVYDLNGRMVMQQKNDATTATLNTSLLQPGVYLLRMQCEDGSIATKKFLRSE